MTTPMPTTPTTTQPATTQMPTGGPLRLDVFSIFPDYLAPLDLSLIGKARRDGLVDLTVHDLREYTHDRHRTVDDTPYGGGAGMVMKPEPWGEALEALQTEALAAGERVRLIVPGPGGTPFTQATARRLAASGERLAFACGRYEGIDERVYEYSRELFDGRVEVISLGDYVLNGGEVAVMAMIEAVARLVPGVVGNAESLVEESHENGLLEYPVYTKPAVWRGRAVPDVLLGGNHGAIEAWRRDRSMERTVARRPDLLRGAALTVGEADLPLVPAVPADAGELFTTTRACWLQEAQLNEQLDIPPVVETLEDTRADLAPDSPWSTWILRDPESGRLIGSVRGARREQAGTTYWEIGRLMVVPDLTGRGIGRALLEFALAATPADVDRARLVVGGRSLRNQKLYKKAGFRVLTGEDPGFGALVMEKRLRR